MSALSDMENEVEDFANEIENISSYNSDVEEYYKGTQIYFSGLVCNPGIMFLGINPGQGYWKQNNEIVRRYEPLDYNEYYDFYYCGGYSGYQLAKDWVDIFENRVCRLDLLKHSVKSNCYFFATKNTSDLNQLKNELDGITDYDLEEKSKEWNRTLLDYIQPYILICEGYGVRDKLYEWYPDEFEMYDEYTGKLSLDNGDIDVLVIKRTYSNIQDKASVSNELSDLINNNDLTFIDDDDCNDCNCDCDDDDDCDDCNCDCDDDDDCDDEDSDGSNSYVSPIVLASILTRKKK